MTMTNDDLAQCLRAWRRRLAPEDVGLAGRATRRRSGLRREEVAALSGVSVHYVQRLEQGTAVTPSPSVVGALADALQLSAAERALLHRLAGHATPPRTPATEELPESVRQLLDRLEGAPALVQDHHWNILALTAAAVALFGDIVGVNGVRLHFADFGVGGRPQPEIEQYDRALVGELNRQLADRPDDVEMRALVDDLRRESPRFAALWADRPADESVPMSMTMVHPVVGTMTLHSDVMSIRNTDLRLVVWSATSGTPDARALEELLGSGGDPRPHDVAAALRDL